MAPTSMSLAAKGLLPFSALTSSGVTQRPVSVTASLDKTSDARRKFLKLALGNLGVGLPTLLGAKKALADEQGVSSSRMSYSRFLEYLDKDRVKKVDLFENGTIAIVEAISPELGNRVQRVRVQLPGLSQELLQKLREKNIDFAAHSNQEESGSLLFNLIGNLAFPLILIGGLFLLSRRAQGGLGGPNGPGFPLGFGQSRAKFQMEPNTGVTFDDVAGVDEAKQDFMEVVEFLKKPERFTAVGARIPKGVLLVGPPGTGKTLLAKAIAGEAGVPFFSISGSEFVEMFVGVGASRVRDLFKKAKENAPCIVFVDEIDAVGRQRGTGIGGGNDEREQTLNQLLTEMDGFEGNTGIIVIAATNRADILDSALLRPGRFDRQVSVDVPDVRGRTEILKVHGGNKKFDADVSLDVIAMRTPGFSGADLANLLNEAAILAGRRGKTAISSKEIDDSIDRIVAGMEGTVMTDGKSKSLVAYHEVGHAICGTLTPGHDPSVGSDLYKDEEDKEKLEKMSELDRELILAERSSRIDDYKLKQMARSKTGKGGARKDSSPPPPPSRMRSSTRADKSGSATKSALDELRAKRMRQQGQQDPEAYRNRFKDLLPQSGSPTRRRAGSPPSDGSNDGDNRGRLNDRGRIADDGRDDEFDESPNRIDPLKFDDVKSITLRRSKLVKWFMEPFFEDLVSGCFVRLGIGKTKSGTPRYRLCIVRNVDASDPDRQYKLESYKTCKYLNVVWDSEANAARWQMSQVSDSPPNEEEFKEWLQEAEKNGVHIPTRQEVMEKKGAIQEAYKFVYSAKTVKEMLQKKSAVRRPINVAAEKDRLRDKLDMALSQGNEAEAERIRVELNKLQKPQPIKKDDKAAKLEAMNRKNRAENFKIASEMKPTNISLKAGEDGYDPFSRRWTRSRNYYAAKPGGDNAEEAANGSGDNAVAGNEDGKNKAHTGTTATAAAQVAAADAGKLIDTNAPVDLGTASNVLHTFDLPISLAALQEFGGAKGLFDGYMARKQKIEAAMGYKVPDNDGRRHALTLSVSDYKRRRGLL